MTKVYNPPHLGHTLKEDILPALKLTVTEASKQLVVTHAVFLESLMVNLEFLQKWLYVLKLG